MHYKKLSNGTKYIAIRVTHDNFETICELIGQTPIPEPNPQYNGQIDEEPPYIGLSFELSGGDSMYVPYGNYLLIDESGKKLSYAEEQAFETDFIPQPETYLERMKIEYFQLMNRLEKLAKFIDNGDADQLAAFESLLLKLQRRAMDQYLTILGLRLYHDTEKFYIPRMTFGQAIEAMKQGYPVRRESWEKTKVVIKQNMNDVYGDILPKMSSLPDKAKELIADTTNEIHYTSQAIIFDMGTGRADSWIPNMDDFYAEDWEVEFGPYAQL